MQNLDNDTIASAYLAGDTAVKSQWLGCFWCAAVPVAVGCFYITGNLCCFHSTTELGRNGEKCMSDIWKQILSSILTLL